MKFLRISVAVILVVGVGLAFDAAAQTETILHSFSGNPDGAHPMAGLVRGSDSNFYGTTSQGGTNSEGSVFSITPVGSVTILHSFIFSSAIDGSTPVAGLVQGSDSNFYGTTKTGGIGFGLDGGLGIVFRITPSGGETNLHSFHGSPDGAFPEAGLIQGNDGNFYGTTFNGGTGGACSLGCGTIFRISASGIYTSLYSFVGNPDGANPTAGLVQGSDGNFYGTTSEGGTNRVGIVFRISPSGSYTNLHTFGGGTAGYGASGLVQGNDSNFYGTTSYGGTNVDCDSGCGTVFRISPSGVYTMLYSFVNDPDGASPQAGLVRASDGNFYGTTSTGGTNHVGTIFRITPNGVETVLFMFGGYPDDGTSLISRLVQGSDGYLYGTTNLGGTNNYGTVFKFLIPPVSLSRPFEITSIVLTNSSSLLITWNTTGMNNIVQITPGVGASGNYSTNGFTDMTNLVVTTVTTNFLDVGAATNKPSRYYRIRSPQ